MEKPEMRPIHFSRKDKAGKKVTNMDVEQMDGEPCKPVQILNRN